MLGAMAADAAPAVTAMPAGDTTTVPAEDLGGVDQIRIPADGLVQRVAVQVPTGLKPLSIQADWQRTPEISAGALTVEQDNKAIAAADVAAAPLVAGNVNIALRNPVVIDDTFTFDLRVRPSGDRAVCSPLLETGSVTLTSMSVVFSGDDTPASVAGFFPNAMQRLVITIPQPATAAQTQAAFTISTLAVRAFDLDPARIETVSTGTNVQLGELERNVEINPASTRGMEVDGRRLVLGGDDATIAKNADALGTDARLLTQVPKAVVDSATKTELPNRSRYSLADLNIPPVNLDGIGRVERTISLSQANVGGPAHNWQARLVGAYEPQPENSNATFSILTNGTMLRSVLLNESGLLDVTVRLPDELAGRNPSLTFRFDTDPTDASCTAANPFSASISSSSSIDIERGNGATASGFTRWPQVALPNLHVAFDDRSIDAIAAGISTVASLQATTTTPIAVSVADTLDSSISDPLFAVITKTQVPDFLHATLPGPGIELVGDDNKNLVALDASEELTSLQAYENEGKNTLVLAGPNAAAVRSLTTQLTGQTDGWFALRGDTWFRAGEHTPASVQARGGSLRVEPIGPATSTVLQRHRAFFIIGAVIIAIVLLGLLYPRMVSDKPASGAHTNGMYGRRSSDRPFVDPLADERPEFEPSRPVQPSSGSLENLPPDTSDNPPDAPDHDSR